MIGSVSTAQSTSIIGIEGVLTAIAVLLAIAVPRAGHSWFARLEALFGQLARRRVLSVAAVGISAILLRLAILPVCPIPLPFVPDDFSFLLSADTFVHGRLTNPTPVMWMHFESIHITMQPSYMSMYFPGQGLLMAAGTLIFGNPWFGLLLASGLMCAAICWMLQAWMPSSWALLGGMIAVVHLGLFSYWINTYHAAGALCAFGGALILGGLPRFKRRPLLRYALIVASGIVILGLTRPYECALLCVPVGIALGAWLIVGKDRPKPRALIRLTVLPLLLVIGAVAWLGYYDTRAFGKATALPYTVCRATYAMAPYYVWQDLRPAPAYRHQVMRDYYSLTESTWYTRLHKSPMQFLAITLAKGIMSMQFFAGIALLVPLVMLRRVLLDRRIRFLVVCVVVLAAGTVIEIFLLPHYLAPFTAAFYALGLQAMRHLRVWKPGGRLVGKALVRLSITVCLAMVCLRLNAGPLHLALPEWPSTWNVNWYGPDHFGTERARVQNSLEHAPGEQLAIVRYSAQHNPFEEWVYNAADIDSSKVIWAREMGAADNNILIDHYAGRRVWLVEPDLMPARVTAYAGMPTDTSQMPQSALSYTPAVPPAMKAPSK